MTNVNVNTVRNVYVNNVAYNNVNRVSYNGGVGGITRQPTAAERGFENERHIAPTSAQLQHEQSATRNQAMLASVNRGRPPIAATPQAGAFEHPNVTAARGAPAPQGTPSNTMHAQSAGKVAPAAGPPQGVPHGQPRGEPHGQGHGGGSEERHPR